MENKTKNYPMAVRTIKEALETNGSIGFCLDFGYYGEVLNITKIDEDKIEVECSVRWSDEYSHGFQEFCDVVSYEEFLDFLQFRLSEELRAVISVNGGSKREIDMKELMGEFIADLRNEKFDEIDALYEKTLSETIVELYKGAPTTEDNEWYLEMVLESDPLVHHRIDTSITCGLENFLTKEIPLWIKWTSTGILFDEDTQPIHDYALANFDKWKKEQALKNK